MTIFRQEAFRAALYRVLEISRRPVALSAAQLVGSRYVAALVQLSTTVVAARLLGPEGYGTVALVVAYPSLLSSIFGTKSEALTTRYMAVYRAEGKHPELLGMCKLGYAMDFLPALVVTLCVLVTSRYFAAIAYDRPELEWLTNVYVIGLPFASLSNTSVAILTSHRAFRMLSALQVLHSLINLLAVAGFLILGLGVTGMILALMVWQICVGLTLCLSAAHVLSRNGPGYWWQGEIRSVSPLLRELIRLVGWNYLRDTLRGVLDSLPVMMLGRYSTADQAAFYRLAVNMANVGRYAESSLNRMIYPILSQETAVAGMTAAKATIKRWTLLGGGPIALVLIGVVLLLPAIMVPLFGSRYQEAIVPAQVMMLGVALCSIFFWVVPCYYSVKKVGALTKAFAAYVAFALIAVWFSLGSFGLLGMVTILAVSRFAYLLVMALGMVWRAGPGWP